MNTMPSYVYAEAVNQTSHAVGQAEIDGDGQKPEIGDG
jgi:hypothetical protein